MHHAISITKKFTINMYVSTIILLPPLPSLTPNTHSLASQDSDKYAVSSETRSQLRVLETIDRVVSKRKQERENEQTLKAAKSRSKGTDPEKVAKLREEAKQVSTKTGLFIRGVCLMRTTVL